MKKLFFCVVLLCAGSAQAALKIDTWTMPNGARVLFVESHAIPVVDLSVEFDAGERRDPRDKAGLAALTNAMLARGVQEARAARPDGGGAPDAANDANGSTAGAVMTTEPALNEAQISDAFADIAAQRGGSAGNDRAGVSLRTLASKSELDRAVMLTARILAQPSFPADILNRDKARTIAVIREDLTRPEAIAEKAFWKALYGNHPYAFNPTVESIEAITRDDLVLFHRTHYVANRAVVTIIGDLGRKDAEAIASQLTMRLPQGAPLPALPDVAPIKGGKENIAHPASQAHIFIGEPALVRGSPDYFPLMVGNYSLGGGGFVSRLTQQVREKRGLSYSVYSYFSPMAQEGPFQIGLQTKKEQTEAALKVVNDTLADFLKTGPTPAELKAAKDNLIGGFALRIDNNRKILDNVAMIGFYRLPLNYLDTWTDNVAKVTADDIRAAFSRHLVQDRLATIVVGAPAP